MEQEKALALIKNIDFDKLRDDKMTLLNMDGKDELQGIINMIDAIQDFAVDTLEMPEEAVFLLFQDKNGELIEKGQTVDVLPHDDFITDFTGTVTGFKGVYVVVEDQDEDAFCISPEFLEVIPEEPLEFDEEKEWNVPVMRTGYGHILIAVSAKSEEEAIDKAIDEAGGELISEKSSEYTAPDGAHLITDQNK